MKRTHYFYFLRGDGLRRYFGRTVNPKKRLYDHVKESEKGTTHKNNWIRSLSNPPVIEPVYSLLCTDEEATATEKTLLKKFMKMYDLTNSHDNCVGASKVGQVVYQYNSNGMFIKTFQNSNHAMIETGISDSNILRSAKNSNMLGSRMAGGYYWLFSKHFTHPYPLMSKKRKTPIVQQLTITGEILAEFDSAADAARTLNLKYKTINAVCNGSKKTAYGYKWKFKT
jgi:hypothetical protein